MLVAVLDDAVDAVLEGVDAGVAGAALAAVDCSDAVTATSFFSPVLAAGASLPEDGFILSE